MDDQTALAMRHELFMEMKRQIHDFALDTSSGEAIVIVERRGCFEPLALRLIADRQLSEHDAIVCIAEMEPLIQLIEINHSVERVTILRTKLKTAAPDDTIVIVFAYGGSSIYTVGRCLCHDAARLNVN